MHYQSKSPTKSRLALCTRSLTPSSLVSQELKRRPVVIAIALHNQAKSLGSTLKSALQQSAVKKGLASILLLDDQSTDNWLELNKQLLQNPNIAIIHGCCGSAARARNALLDYVDEHFDARWVCRLDADDMLATPKSVEILCQSGDVANATFVIGSNALIQNGRLLNRTNIADPAILKNRNSLTSFVRNSCLGKQRQELPSCNLVLRAHSGYRYPNIRSAEDHWLVAHLLMLYPDKGHVQPEPLYAVYSTSGDDTRQNKATNNWRNQRKKLAHAISCLNTMLNRAVNFLGAGREGIVWCEDNIVHKRFYPWAINSKDIKRLSALLEKESPHLLKPEWYKKDHVWHCASTYEQRWPISRFIERNSIVRFLQNMYRLRIAPLNIKRDNMMMNGYGDLVYIDIGNDITDLSVSKFLDISARLYSICILGWNDEEVVRRSSTQRQDEALKHLLGFEEFYKEAIHSLHPHLFADRPSLTPTCNRRVSLLIKACAQDKKILINQVKHIVSQLSYPQGFTEIILLIDSQPGPFLRQYEQPDLEGVITDGELLLAENWIDMLLVSPRDPSIVSDVYFRWFKQKSAVHTHTHDRAPLFAQLWGFEQLTTRYVLQCDCDVLIGRKDWRHDYLQDMLAAIRQKDVFCVGFNIPKAKVGFRMYEASPGDYVPEVRMGLLDMKRILQQLPIENPAAGESLSLSWHRALHLHQQKTGYRSLRGGDSRTFYIHPRNEDKPDLELDEIRDLIAQGRYPQAQQEHFDLVPGPQWSYDKREEEIVFLLKGSRTPLDKLSRCLQSLKEQTVQKFGLILIDDLTDFRSSCYWPFLLGGLFERTTLIRRTYSAGRMPNFIDAIQRYCTNPETLIVVLDQDDALMDNQLVDSLIKQLTEGADLIQAPMFRPDKPLKQYNPDYHKPRNKGGGEVWAHLRAFKKQLFEQVPKEYFKFHESWVEQVTDYATMLPMTELAKKPVFLDQCYAYYHQREKYNRSVKVRQKEILDHLLSLPALDGSQANG